MTPGDDYRANPRLCTFICLLVPRTAKSSMNHAVRWANWPCLKDSSAWSAPGVLCWHQSPALLFPTESKATLLLGVQ